MDCAHWMVAIQYFLCNLLIQCVVLCLFTAFKLCTECNINYFLMGFPVGLITVASKCFTNVTTTPLCAKMLLSPLENGELRHREIKAKTIKCPLTLGAQIETYRAWFFFRVLIIFIAPFYVQSTGPTDSVTAVSAPHSCKSGLGCFRLNIQKMKNTQGMLTLHLGMSLSAQVQTSANPITTSILKIIVQTLLWGSDLSWSLGCQPRPSS